MNKKLNLLIAGLIAGLFLFSQANAQMMHNQDEKKSQTGMMMQKGMMGQGGCNMMEKMKSGFGFFLDLKDKLSLTDAQVTQLRDMKFAYEKANIQRKSALDIARLELKQLKAAEKIDAGKIEGKIREVQSKKADIEVAKFQARVKAKAVLTDEQKAKAKDMSCSMCGQMHEGGMMKGMMGQDGMMQKGQQKDNAAQHEQHHKKE